jgi:WD40-like Beta Propeller Repeat
MSRLYRRPVHAALLKATLLCALTFGCTVGVAPAFAAVHSFGEEGEGAGQFARAQAIAIDNGSFPGAPSAGDVYIADAGNSRVDKFAGDGEFLLAWGWGVADGKAEFEICGPDASPATAGCQAGSEGAAAGQLERPVGVAVDTSSGSSHGDVYVEDKRNNRIEKFTESGHFLLAWGWGVADGKAEAETCGPEATPATSICLTGLEGNNAGEFESLMSNTVAVSAVGAVLVGDGSRVEKFSEHGVFEAEIALPGPANECDALAIDSAGNLYAVRSENGVAAGLHKYDGAGSELSTPDPLAGPGSAIALGAANELFVEDPGGRIAEYQATGTEVASFPAPGAPTSIAFGDQAGQLYVLDESQVELLEPPLPGPLVESEGATAEPAGAATVRANIDPEGKQTKYRLEYGVEPSGETATPTVTLTAEGFEPQAVEVKLSGLKPKTLYHFHFVAENVAGTTEGDAAAFETLPPVAIDSESVAQVSSRSARFATVIDPLTLPTEYHFEYGTEDCLSAVHECAKAPVPDASAGSGIAGVPFSVLVEGLTPGTTYHYRVVAHNHCNPAVPAEVCVVEGADRTFTTQAGEGSGLIDGRAWELVSPIDKHGSALEGIAAEGGIVQAAEDGGAVAYIAKAPVDAEPAGNRSFAEQQLLATRGARGWSTSDLATPHEAVAGLKGGELSEYRQFSPDLSTAMLEPSGATPLSPWASERTPYRRAASGEYTPLLTGCPAAGTPCSPAVEEHADVPPGTRFASKEENGQLFQKTGVEFRVATPDLSHALITAPQALTPPFETGGFEAVYAWSGGRVKPVSVLPGGASAIGENGASVGQNDQLMRNALSADGERAFFESEHHLFFRDMAREESVQLDVPQEGVRSGTGEARFQYATPEGAKAFFTDAARLTADATAKESEPDLYMCALSTSVDEQSCAAKHDLKDLTVGFHGQAPDVQGAMIGASEDGSYVYFVANGVLTNSGTPVTGAVHGNCRQGEREGSCDLYVWHDGVTSLVAVLTGNDFPDWEAGLGADLSRLTARVSPNGRYLAFMSQRSLTGYDNRDAASGAPDEEVFLYDAASARTVCASCDPTGARPFGVLEPQAGQEATLLVDRVGAWSNHWVAGSIPGWTPGRTSTALYQSRYLSNEGRLFFDTPVGLVPADTNSTQDVYEFEPEGVGSCSSGASSGAVVFVKEVAGSAVGGCVGLISSGTSSEESVFLDASSRGPGNAEGEDVFFLTAARLAGADVDSALDVYDAHVCSAAVPCPATTATVAPPTCTTAETCRTTPGGRDPDLTVFDTPASMAPSGTGNLTPQPKPASTPVTRAQRLAKALKACRKSHDRKRRAKCEKQARHTYGVSKAKKATEKRGATR